MAAIKAGFAYDMRACLASSSLFPHLRLPDDADLKHKQGRWSRSIPHTWKASTSRMRPV